MTDIVAASVLVTFLASIVWMLKANKNEHNLVVLSTLVIVNMFLGFTLALACLELLPEVSW